MSYDLEKLFSGPGKRYHGVRYPQGFTIALPLCIVTVLPEDGQPYVLDPKQDVKNYCVKIEKNFRSRIERFEFAWGIEENHCWVPWDNDGEVEFSRGASDMREHKCRTQQLALALLCDILGDDDLAKKMVPEFTERVVRKLPEFEWNLLGKDILTLFEYERVLAAMARIPG